MFIITATAVIKQIYNHHQYMYNTSHAWQRNSLIHLLVESGVSKLSTHTRDHLIHQLPLQNAFREPIFSASIVGTTLLRQLALRETFLSASCTAADGHDTRQPSTRCNGIRTKLGKTYAIHPTTVVSLGAPLPCGAQSRNQPPI